MDGTLQERVPCWLGLLTGHAAHGAGACCTLFVEAMFRHRGQPGTMLAPALLTYREKQQQHILTPASAKTAPAQRHAHHCSICGAVKHTQAHIRTHNSHTRMHTHIHKRARILTGAHTHIHITHTLMCTHIQTQTRVNTHRCAHACTHAHAQTHSHI